jgi:YihY family inner membrane protein
MSTATHVPETSRFKQDELSADDARTTLTHTGTRRLLEDSFKRMRYGDGFTATRALAFQFVLSLIPLLIAFVGLASLIKAEKLAQALRETILSVAPGGKSDAFKQVLTRGLSEGGSGGRLALGLGLLAALVSLTTAMGQIERGANRIYGIQRDRPSGEKYGRAALLVVTGGIPAMLGFVLIVGGGAFIDALQSAYGWGSATGTVLQVLRWPVGVGLGIVAVTAMFRWAPRRNQPGLSWLAVGAAVALVLWLVFSGLLALYISHSSSFGAVYGPLTGMIALLLWSQLTSLALFLGVAFAAQLEAVRAGVPSPATPDPEGDPSARTEQTVLLRPEPAPH